MRRILLILIGLTLILGLSGCATIKRKFTRKKKKENKPEVILALEDYDKFIDYHELYKKHYLLWQYWHDELIASLEKNFKKQRQCVEQSLEHLRALGKYITEEKKELLNTYVERLEEIREKILKRRLNPIERDRISRELQKLKRLIDKEFRYSEIKAYIVTPTKQE
jgi:hypothetical protein